MSTQSTICTCASCSGTSCACNWQERGAAGRTAVRSRERLLARLGVAATLLLAAAPAVARGQALDAVAPNTRIRVDLHGDRSRFGRERAQSVIGTLVAVRADTVLLLVRASADPLRLPRTSIRGAYLSRGRPPRWQAALRGAVVPAVIGAALSALTMTIHRDEGDPTPMQAAGSSAAWGALSGAVFGAWSPRERWHRLSPPLPQSLAVQPIQPLRSRPSPTR
jgi:hypothetical protein